MYDNTIIYEKLIQIDEALERIKRRSKNINSADDFLDTENGLDMLDAIGMMLIAIGENLKKIDTETEGKLFAQYPDINWRGAKGARDILSHHYFDIDAEEVYDICKNDIPSLSAAIKDMVTRHKSS